MTQADPPVPARESLVTPRFAIVVASALLYFVALGMLLPVLPVYVREELGGETSRWASASAPSRSVPSCCAP